MLNIVSTLFILWSLFPVFRDKCQKPKGSVLFVRVYFNPVIAHLVCHQNDLVNVQPAILPNFLKFRKVCLNKIWFFCFFRFDNFLVSVSFIVALLFPIFPPDLETIFVGPKHGKCIWVVCWVFYQILHELNYTVFDWVHPFNFQRLFIKILNIDAFSFEKKLNIEIWLFC